MSYQSHWLGDNHKSHEKDGVDIFLLRSLSSWDLRPGKMCGPHTLWREVKPVQIYSGRAGSESAASDCSRMLETLLHFLHPLQSSVICWLSPCTTMIGNMPCFGQLTWPGVYGQRGLWSRVGGGITYKSTILLGGENNELKCTGRQRNRKQLEAVKL